MLFENGALIVKLFSQFRFCCQRDCVVLVKKYLDLQFVASQKIPPKAEEEVHLPFFRSSPSLRACFLLHQRATVVLFFIPLDLFVMNY